MLKTELNSLVIPEEQAALQAGHILENIPMLWAKAKLEVRHTILGGFLRCVYVDLKEPASVVGIKPKPQFMGLFQLMDTHSGSPTPLENKSSEPD